MRDVVMFLASWSLLDQCRHILGGEGLLGPPTLVDVRVHVVFGSLVEDALDFSHLLVQLWQILDIFRRVLHHLIGQRPRLPKQLVLTHTPLDLILGAHNALETRQVFLNTRIQGHIAISILITLGLLFEKSVRDLAIPHLGAGDPETSTQRGTVFTVIMENLHDGAILEHLDSVGLLP